MKAAAAVVVVGSSVDGVVGFCVDGVVGFCVDGVVGFCVDGFCVVGVVVSSVVVATSTTTTSGAVVVALFKPSLQMAPVTQNLGWTVMQMDCSSST